MNQYQIHLTVDFTTMVEAETEDAAKEAASCIAMRDFDSEMWSPMKVLLIRPAWLVKEQE